MVDVNTPAAAARILVVEDESKLADIMAKALVGQGYDVEVVGRGDDALSRLTQLDVTWSLVVLDRMLPGVDGITICERLRAADNDVPILMLTAMGSVDERVVGLDSGANDYLPKPFALKELYARVRVLLRTHGPSVAAVPGVDKLVVGDLELDVEGLVAYRGDARIDLRPKEAVILACLMRQPDRVVGRWVILDQAWTVADAPSSNDLDVHIRRVRQKVDRPFARASIETVRGAGYRIRSDGR